MNAAQDSGQDVLHEYARLKLDLAAIVRAVLHNAQLGKDDLSVGECRRILARLAEDRLNVAFVGQFSRGKSSLMNAILGSAKLPTGILPLTSVITTVTYGEKERVLVQREGWGFPQEISLDQLQDYVTQARNPGNEKRVRLAEVQLPNELLRLGVQFIDTPGIASTIAANTRTTRQFLPEIDAAILVTSFDSPMTEAEVGFLREIHEHVRRLFVVVNKLDLATEQDRESVIGLIHQAVQNAFPEIEPEVYAISARLALEAKHSGSAVKLAQSGLPALEHALSEFLQTGKTREFLLRTADRTMQVVHQREIMTRISKCAGDQNGAAALGQRLQKLAKGLDQDQHELIVTMLRELPAEFRKRCLAVAPVNSSEAVLCLALALENWFSAERSGISGAVFEQYLSQTLHKLFSEWKTRSREQIEIIFQELTSRQANSIDPIIAKIADLPGLVLGVEQRPDVQFHNDIPVVFRDLHADLETFQAPWWYELVLLSSWRKHLAARWRKRAGALGSLLANSASDLLETAMTDWIESIDRELSSLLERTTAQIQLLLEHNLDPEISDEFESFEGRLKEFMLAVPSVGAESLLFLSETARHQNVTRIPPCLICIRVEKALKEFMARCQYELSVSEHAQRDHALRSGFCPLHTWQYEAIASPQGVCSAYPDLLSLYAANLRLLAQADSVQAMEEGVRKLLPNAATCPACQVAASIEKDLAEGLARQFDPDEPSDGVVCAFHLRSVLLAFPSVETAAGLLLNEAHGFERLAEDMQNHVLKHEAIRHHLSTRSERDAAEDGLCHLVGRRDTVAPWRIE